MRASQGRTVRSLGVTIVLSAAVAVGGLAPAHAEETWPDPATPTPTAAPTPDAEPTPVPEGPEPDADLPPGPATPALDPEPPSDLATSVPVLAAELPSGPTAPAPAPNPIDAYSPYRPQTTCDPTVKPGTRYLLDLLVSHYGGRKSSTSRACDVGGTSEHKEGRALDWGVNVANPAEKAAGDSFVNWLTAVGPDDKVGYNARRLGVMYVIWNGRIWNNTSSAAAWRTYTGSSPHTDHVHVSLSWNGAYLRNSWWTGVAAASELSISRYVTRVYQDLFDRAPDPGGLQTWTGLLNTGTPRIEVANRITGSTEYRTRLITATYQSVLGRDPDPQGLSVWLSRLRAGMTIQQMEAGFLASPEFYQRAGATDASWVRGLYAQVLRRDASDSEVSDWTGRLASSWSRNAVALHFVYSVENLTNVVDQYYWEYLGRGLDPVGLKTWVYSIKNGMRLETVIGRIIASNEYFNRAIAS